MSTDQIAAEAAVEYLGTSHGTGSTDRLEAIIKSAIEKVRPLIEAEHTGEMLKQELESRTAHASEQGSDISRMIENLNIAKRWMQHETVYAYDSPHEQGMRRRLASSKQNVDKVIKFLQSWSRKPDSASNAGKPQEWTVWYPSEGCSRAGIRDQNGSIVTEVRTQAAQDIVAAHNATLQPQDDTLNFQLQLQEAVALLAEAKSRIGNTAFPALSARIEKFITAMRKEAKK